MDLPWMPSAPIFLSRAFFRLCRSARSRRCFSGNLVSVACSLGLPKPTWSDADAVPGSGGEQGEETDGGGQEDVHVLQAV